MTKWMESEGPLKAFIISSRIRLARNFSAYPFPVAMNQESAQKFVEDIRNEVYLKSESFKKNHKFYAVSELNDLEKRLLVEKHLISSEFANVHIPEGLITSHDESVSIMINEEDHLRIQCLLPGLQLNKAWQQTNEIDDYIDEMMGYAFDEKLGYLTCCPTNVGTGMRASVMMHLPALTYTGTMDRILQAAGQLGLAIRGLYGEGSESHGSMYQISNQITLGRKEDEIIDTLNDVAGQIAAEERKARELLLRTSGLELEDRVYRSLGVLSSSRILTSKEALERFSDLRLGIETGIIEDMELVQVDDLLFRIQPAFLQKVFNEPMDPHVRDIRRADMVRNKLKGVPLK